MAELMEFVLDVENKLGWAPRGANIYKARAAACRKLARSMTKAEVTFDDLKLAVSWCRSRRHQIAEPADLVRLVRHAKARAAEPEVADPVDQEILRAIGIEYARDDDESTDWIGRLIRAEGNGRTNALYAWKAAARE